MLAKVEMLNLLFMATYWERVSFSLNSSPSYTNSFVPVKASSSWRVTTHVIRLRHRVIADTEIG